MSHDRCRSVRSNELLYSLRLIIGRRLDGRLALDESGCVGVTSLPGARCVRVAATVNEILDDVHNTPIFLKGPDLPIILLL